MKNNHTLLKHITSRYIIAGMIGSSLMTACNKIGLGYGMAGEEEQKAIGPIPIRDANNDPKPDTFTPVTTSPELEPVDEHGNNRIQAATSKGNTDEVKNLSTDNPYLLKTVNKYGNTILHIAATRNYIEIIQHIITLIKEHPELNYILNMKNINGHTAGHQAGRKES